MLALLINTVSWGPYTHQSLCAHYSLRNSSEFVAGCSAPDAFKHIKTGLHSLPFAAALFATANGTAEVDFALGYGCHLAADVVGHRNNGFLNPQSDHPLELATDAMNFRDAHRGSLQQISSKMSDLVSRASAGSVNSVSESEASTAVAKFRVLTTTEAAALAVDAFYQKQMIRFSFCNVSSFAEVMDDYQRASLWNKEACSTWQLAMLEGTPSPEAVLYERVGQLFVSNGGTSC